jgi:sugar phosphate permease
MFAVPISTVIGAPLSGLVLNLEGVAGLHGWQWMFLLEGAPSLALAVAVWFYLTDRPGDARWLGADESTWLRSRLDAERRNREALVRLSWLQSLRDPRIIAFGFVYMAMVIPQYGLGFFLPQIVEGFGGLGNVAAGLVTALPYLVGAIGMLLWGRHSDRTGERKFHVVIPLALIVLGLGLAAVTAAPALKMLWLCVAGFGFFAVLPVFWTLPTALLSGTAAAAGIAAINSIGNLGGYVGPQIFGLLRDRTGADEAGLIFLAFCAIVGIVIVLVLGHNPALERAAPERAAPRAAD